MIIKSDYIREQLSVIEAKVKNNTKQKLYDINKTAEDIFMHILNDVYGWKLVNANDIKANFPAIDLIDTTKGIVIQVTSSIDDSKVTSTIAKFSKFGEDDYKDGIYTPYAHYDLKMFYIKDKPKKFTKLTETKIENQNMNLVDDFLGIEDINTKVSAEPKIATKVFKTLCEILHDKTCDSDTPPQLTIKSSTHDKNFIGREDEVKVIDTRLENSNSLLLINGIGGIGKSSLANYYLYTRENEFDYYGFIEGLDSFISEFRNSLDLKAQKEEELYREIIFQLQGLKGNKLLVIDNVEDIESHKELIEMILSLHKYDYKILFTSRRKIKNVTAYPLGTLSLDDARELFLSYFKTDELKKVDEIIDYLGLHTLFIKLVAETIENEGYSLDDILKKFENRELSKIEFIDEESGEELTLNKNLQELFSMQNLKDEYVLLLKRLAVLPPIDIELSFLEEILGKERLKGRLNFLVGRGWLIENDGNYKLHQIIKEFLLANYAPCFVEIEKIVEYFLKYEREIEEWITIFIKSVVDVCIKYNLKDKKVAELYNWLGIKYYDDLANRKKSKIYLNHAKSLYTEVGEKVNPDIYHRLGHIDNNLDYLNRALSQYKEENNEKQRAICLNDIGTVYWNQGLLDEALSYFEEELKLLKENNFRGLAINHNQQSLVYKNQQDINKAFEYQVEAINLIKKAKEEDNSWLNQREEAQLINNLGELYMDETVKFDLAFKYIRESLDLREKCLYEGHERFGESYDNLAIIEEKRTNINLAREYQLKAIEIWEENPPEKDIYLKEAQERLKGLK